VIVATLWAVTGVVLTVKVAESRPAGIVTLRGTSANTLLVNKETANPPVSAFPLNVTVPVDVLPPGTIEGLTDKEERAVLERVSVAVADWVLK
jgi:hypothetical protein